MLPRPAAFALLALAVLAGCRAKIGDPCLRSTDCSLRGDRMCDLSNRVDGAGNRTPTGKGECTVEGCGFDTCPKEAACVKVYGSDFLSIACDPEREDIATVCEPGTLGCACDENDACLDAANECIASRCLRTAGCFAGTVGCLCAAGACGDGSGCIDGVCTAAAGCAAGSVGCACDQGSCSGDLRCAANVCIHFEQPCVPGTRGCACDAGACTDGSACNGGNCELLVYAPLDDCDPNEVCLAEGLCADEVTARTSCRRECKDDGDCRAGYECVRTGSRGIYRAPDPNRPNDDTQVKICTPEA